MKGVFIYNPDTQTLTMQSDDSKPIRVLPIVLAGDENSYIEGEKAYQKVVLWFNVNKDGTATAVLASATPPPWNRSISLGRFAANILTLPRHLIQAEKFYQPCRNNTNNNQKYKHPAHGSFIPEFLSAWRAHRTEAKRGWFYLSALLIGGWVGFKLLQII